MPKIYFGDASGDYPKGFPENWGKFSSLRRRPEEDGADAVVFGNRPIAWATQVVIFGANYAALKRELSKWWSARSTKETLRLDDPGADQFPGVFLASVNNNWGPRRIFNASNSAAFEMGLGLVFLKLSET